MNGLGTVADAARKTSGFAVRSASRALRPARSAHPDIPAHYPRPGVLATVFAEEMMLLLASNRGPAVEAFDFDRIADETRATLDVFAERGVLGDPISYHRTPPAPRRVDSSVRKQAGIAHSVLSFESDYVPFPGMPGAERYLANATNGRCYAQALLHTDKQPRPWLVYLHAYNMGGAFDLRLIQAAAYHHDLGFNVLAPVLPLHGPRREPGSGGLLSLDWVANVHGLTQAVWDVRRWLAWIREHEASSVAVHGISLGGYLAALMASTEPDLDCVVAGLPAATVHGALMAVASQSSRMRRAMELHDLLGANAEAVHRVVTPTALPCLVPHDRRYIYAGLADRIATPLEPYRLWKHWEEPSIHWSDRSHVGAVTSRGVRRFVRDAVTSNAS